MEAKSVRSVRYNVAGASTREMARSREVRWLWLVLIGLFCLGGVLLLNEANRGPGKISVLLVCVIGMVFVGKVIVPAIDLLQKREGDAVRGAEAEEAVGLILNRLPNTYVVWHDVPAAYGNIDHIVLRQDGALFMLETKSHRGKISEQNGQLHVNGKSPPKSFVRQAAGNAIWLGDAIKAQIGVVPWVNAAIVFPNAYVSIRRTLGKVDVISARYLQTWLAKAPANREVGRRVAALGKPLEFG